MALGGIVGNWLRGRLEGRIAVPLIIAAGLLTRAAAPALLGLTAVAGVAVFGSGYDYALSLVAALLAGIAWDIVYVICLIGVRLRDQQRMDLMVGLFFTLTLTVAALTRAALAIGLLFHRVGLGPTLLVAAVLMAAIALRFALGGVAESDSSDPEASPSVTSTGGLL